MDKLGSILVLCSRTAVDRPLLEKAVFLARSAQAEIHLFSCDAALARTLSHAYPTEVAERACEISLTEHLAYLRKLRQSVSAPDLQISVDAACRYPLYDGVAAKLAETPVDLIMKSPSGSHPLRRLTFDANDWQLLRQSPVSLMLVSGRPWRAVPQFAAMVDISADPTLRMADTVLHTSDYLSLACRGELDVIYSETSSDTGTRSAHAGDLQRLSREHHIQPGHLHLLDGAPEQTLPAFAAHRQYDAIILGGLTHKAGLAALAGTLTSRLVEVLQTDFILVKGDLRQSGREGSSLRPAPLPLRHRSEEGEYP
ncbi:MAG TPA: hypothetical protein VMT29_14510 [Steroidobacteraceae bacterium]|nr:hypothetical protein [Steroidobacteraceae bacterium]